MSEKIQTKFILGYTCMFDFILVITNAIMQITVTLYDVNYFLVVHTQIPTYLHSAIMFPTHYN